MVQHFYNVSNNSTELTYLGIVPPGTHMPLIGGYSLCCLMEDLNNKITENRRFISTKTSDPSLLYPTVKTEIIETGARTSRSSSFGLGGENTARKFLQPSAETADLTKRGNSNVLVPVSIIISVFTVCWRECQKTIQ